LRVRRDAADDDLPAILLAAVPLVAPAPQSPLELYDRLLPPPVLARLNDIADSFLPAHVGVLDGDLPALLAAPSDAASLASMVQAEGDMLPRSDAILRCASCAVAPLHGEPGYPVTPWSLPRVGRQWLYRFWMCWEFLHREAPSAAHASGAGGVGSSSGADGASSSAAAQPPLPPRSRSQCDMTCAAGRLNNRSAPLELCPAKDMHLTQSCGYVRCWRWERRASSRLRG